MGSCLVVGDGETERRQFPLLAVAHALALPLAIQAHVLVLTLVVPHRLLVLAAPSAPASGAQVLCGLQVVLEHRALLVPLHAGTVHLVFTADIQEDGREKKRNEVWGPTALVLLLCH